MSETAPQAKRLEPEAAQEALRFIARNSDAHRGSGIAWREAVAHVGDYIVSVEAELAVTKAAAAAREEQVRETMKELREAGSRLRRRVELDQWPESGHRHRCHDEPVEGCPICAWDAAIRHAALAALNPTGDSDGR